MDNTIQEGSVAYPYFTKKTSLFIGTQTAGKQTLYEEMLCC